MTVPRKPTVTPAPAPAPATDRPRGAPARAEKSTAGGCWGRRCGTVFWFSGLTVREVTHLTCIRPGRLRAILGGEVVPTWPTTFMVVTVMRGSPDDVRGLWEWAGATDPVPGISRWRDWTGSGPRSGG
ncbi:hypothetical protein EQG64_31595 [Streptomyces sp. S6]|nr:hypothetical protein EQG64_31595 [Streptomyces sp. S6]